nr:MAG TPA: hypothetical protein [Caudoviricetes sp.]
MNYIVIPLYRNNVLCQCVYYVKIKHSIALYHLFLFLSLNILTLRSNSFKLIINITV